MFWVCFIPIGIAHILVLPPGETFDRFFFADIILDSFKKKFVQIPDPNPAKGHYAFDNARLHLADHAIQTNIFSWWSLPAHSLDVARPTSNFFGI
jgi:hypothetical protein